MSAHRMVTLLFVSFLVSALSAGVDGAVSPCDSATHPTQCARSVSFSQPTQRFSAGYRALDGERECNIEVPPSPVFRHSATLL